MARRVNRRSARRRLNTSVVVSCRPPRQFVPTSELLVGPTNFARQMSELGCRPTRPHHDNAYRRQVRGYRISDINAAVHAIRTRQPVTVRDTRP